MSEAVVLEHAKNAGTDFLMYTGNFCGYCTAAKRLFSRKNVSVKEYNFDEHPKRGGYGTSLARGWRAA